MSIKFKNTWAKWFFFLATAATIFQTMLTVSPLHGNIIVSAVVMFMASAFTAFQQYFNTKVKNNALWATLAVTIAGVLAGVNDLMGVIPMSDTAAQWGRLTINFLITCIGAFSKIAWPTEEEKLAVIEKKILKAEAKQVVIEQNIEDKAQEKIVADAATDQLNETEKP